MTAPKALSLLLVTLTLGATPTYGQSPARAAEIRTEMERISDGDFSCTRMRKYFRRAAKMYPEYHFAFAGRRAVTITGMMGCGYAFNVTEEDAQARAMARCKRSEARLGTGGRGNLKCVFMN